MVPKSCKKERSFVPEGKWLSPLPHLPGSVKANSQKVAPGKTRALRLFEEQTHSLLFHFPMVLLKNIILSNILVNHNGETYVSLSSLSCFLLVVH